MYVLVYAPHGIVGEDGSWAEMFDSYEEAYERMKVCVYTYPERDCMLRARIYRRTGHDRPRRISCERVSGLEESVRQPYGKLHSL